VIPRVHTDMPLHNNTRQSEQLGTHLTSLKDVFTRLSVINCIYTHVKGLKFLMGFESLDTLEFSGISQPDIIKKLHTSTLFFHDITFI